VCDAARLELDRWLQKRGLIKPGDPGNSNSALFDAERDQQIREIIPVLVKAGVMETASTPLGAKPKDEPKNPDAGARPPISPKSSMPGASDSSAALPQHKRRSWWVWLLVLVAATLGAAWLMMRKPK
jgi:hypothetical protein